MINLTFDLVTGVAKLAQTATIKVGADVPILLTLSSAPGVLSVVQFALGSDAATPAVLAYVDTFVQENETTWSAVLDADDTRLLTFMSGKTITSVNAELVVVNDGVRQISPNVAVSVQPAIISGPTSTLGGPVYLTEAEVAALIASAIASSPGGAVPSTVAGKYRFKVDGSVQLWNADQSLFQTLTISGAPGAETLGWGTGEA